jgi:hypothetical protein
MVMNSTSTPPTSPFIMSLSSFKILFPPAPLLDDIPSTLRCLFMPLFSSFKDTLTSSLNLVQVQVLSQRYRHIVTGHISPPGCLVITEHHLSCIPIQFSQQKHSELARNVMLYWICTQLVTNQSVSNQQRHLTNISPVQIETERLAAFFLGVLLTQGPNGKRIFRRESEMKNTEMFSAITKQKICDFPSLSLCGRRSMVLKWCLGSDHGSGNDDLQLQLQYSTQ